MSNMYEMDEDSLSYEEVLAILEQSLLDQDDEDFIKPLNFHLEGDEEEWDEDL